MDELKKGPTWLEWALIVVLIVVVVIVSLVLFGPQINSYIDGPVHGDNLWLHVVGL